MLPAVQSPHVLDFISHSAAQTVRIGHRLGEHVREKDVILLMGGLGVGKTNLVSGIVQGLGSGDRVTSPTFVLIHEYRAGANRGRMRIYHVDLYRIEDESELETIGLEEMWDTPSVCIVEWAERAEAWLPREHLAIYMQHLDETKRVLRFVPRGTHYQYLVETFKSTAFG